MYVGCVLVSADPSWKTWDCFCLQTSPQHTVMYMSVLYGILLLHGSRVSLQTFFLFSTCSAPSVRSLLSGERTSGSLLIGSLVFLCRSKEGQEAAKSCSVDCSEWPPFLCSPWRKSPPSFLPFSHVVDTHLHTHTRTHTSLSDFSSFFFVQLLHLLDFNFFVNTVKCILISLTCFDIFKSRQQLIRKRADLGNCVHLFRWRVFYSEMIWMMRNRNWSCYGLLCYFFSSQTHGAFYCALEL